MAILIKENIPSLVDMSIQDFIKLGINGVYTTMKTVLSHEYIFNLTLHMKNLCKYTTEFLNLQRTKDNEEYISKILKCVTVENIRKHCCENIKKAFEFLNNLNDDLKRKYFNENSDYMIIVTVMWETENNNISLNRNYSILCFIKSLPCHPNNIQIDIMYGQRKLPNIKYTDVFEIKDKLLKMKCPDSHEIVLYNDKHEITEGLTCNFFCFFNDTLYTSKDELVLNGTIRKEIIDLCEKEGVKLKKDSINIKDIEYFEFCFICSTTRNILPIKKIILFSDNKKTFEKNVNHPILIHLQKKLQEIIEKKKEKYDVYIS
ncbi:aminodeoxychorismate lyase, putative [Plasmodium gallinaceum]|uniref:Aminodeoxychorismate lyase, putative n=1 Tax=Plasmodium gallinaceum TaxID=5849 RepID=A0A1J1GR83_PLAGA|nr:aminodeoxychorismate lyase, putative [Plasmodium gallinaceum]CRG94780.1 aminodeoxychorismate lyase, putative [Plasmodium gallinaceum]